jgi:hypothetical protein
MPQQPAKPKTLSTSFSFNLDANASKMQQEMDSVAQMQKISSLDSWATAGLKVKKANKPMPKAESEHIKLLKVGADVEVFLRDYDGRPVPVCGLIGGTKDEPMPVISKGYALQEDNVALEYNIPAAANRYEFVYSLMRISEEIMDRTKKLGLSPAIEASMRFDPKQLESDQAKVFGCDPDYNVWEQKVNEKPSAHPDSATLRTAGGHIHLSFLVDGEVPKHPDNIAEMEVMVMAMDIFLGVPFSLIDTDKERRKMYGKAGAFRPKTYGDAGGVEYRVLSPYWTKTPEMMAYTYKQVERAVEACNKYNTPRATFLHYKESVYKAINNGDREHAHYLLAEFNINIPRHLIG